VIYNTSQFGIVYGPYGNVGFVQRQDLRKLGFSFRGLFRWAKRAFGSSRS
jgi:hypothetical protein